MGDHSQEEQALMKIQHEWAEARVKGDSSYTRRIEADDCTIVWPDGRIVNKRGDLQSMTGDIVFSEFKIRSIFEYAFMATLESSSARASSKRTRKARSSRRKIRLDRHICETGRSMEGGRFTNHSGLGKMIAHS